MKVILFIEEEEGNPFNCPGEHIEIEADIPYIPQIGSLFYLSDRMNELLIKQIADRISDTPPLSDTEYCENMIINIQEYMVVKGVIYDLATNKTAISLTDNWDTVK